MIVRKLFLVFCFLLIVHGLFSQATYSQGDFWSRVRYGGGLGLGFGNGSFNAAISPSAIYEVNNEFAVGTSLNFNYAKFQEARLVAYGGSILTLYNPIHFLQLSTELEQLRVNRTLQMAGGTIEENYWSPALFLGVGYSNRNVTFGLRYDVLYNENKSIYANALMPFVRLYF